MGFPETPPSITKDDLLSFLAELEPKPTKLINELEKRTEDKSVQRLIATWQLVNRDEWIRKYDLRGGPIYRMLHQPTTGVNHTRKRPRESSDHDDDAVFSENKSRNDNKTPRLASFPASLPPSVERFIDDAESFENQAEQALLDSRKEKDEFKAALKRGDAFILYMKMCNIVHNLPKHPGWEKYLPKAIGKYKKLNRRGSEHVKEDLEKLISLLKSDYHQFAQLTLVKITVEALCRYLSSTSSTASNTRSETAINLPPLVSDLTSLINQLTVSEAAQRRVTTSNDARQTSVSVSKSIQDKTLVASPPSRGNSSVLRQNLHQDGSIQRSHVFVGFTNLGNTCYMNSVLQCLMATQRMTDLFSSGRCMERINDSNSKGSKGKMTCAFWHLVGQKTGAVCGDVINTETFRESVCAIKPVFCGAEQHDSQEFLVALLDGLHEDMNQGTEMGGRGYLATERAQAVNVGEDDDDEQLTEKQAADRAWIRGLRRNDSPIVELFQGQLQSQLRCHDCGKASTTYSSFYDLSLEIPSYRQTLTLQDCLDEFCKDEVLDEADQWCCPRCKKPRRATKTMRISRLPLILMVHLKRFRVKHEQGTAVGDKLDT